MAGARDGHRWLRSSTTSSSPTLASRWWSPTRSSCSTSSSSSSSRSPSAASRRSAASGRPRRTGGRPRRRPRSRSAGCWPRRQTDGVGHAGHHSALARDVPLGRAWVTLEMPGRDRLRPLADTGAGPVPIRRSSRPSSGRPATNRPAGSGPTSRPCVATRSTARQRCRRPGQDRDRRASFSALSGDRCPAATPSPDPAATRLMALAADQLALALRRDQLRDEAVRAEVARRSDAFKSALLESVSHDLRTPLASIRATADNLADPAATPSPAEVRAAAEGIDTEVERLDRLVRSVLDLSRIGSGTLAPDLEVHDLTALVEAAIQRMRPALGARSLTFEPPRRTVARPRRRRPPRHGHHEPARQHRPAHAPHPRGSTSRSTGRTGSRQPDDRGRRPRCPTGRARARSSIDFRRGPVSGRDGAAPRDGDRAVDRPRHDRGDGRHGNRAREPARWTRRDLDLPVGARTARERRRCDRCVRRPHPDRRGR